MFTFDGTNKVITLPLGMNFLEVSDLYSRWKEWALTTPNFLPAFDTLGGDPLPGGRFLGSTYFLINGWKIRPYEGDHVLVVSGNLYSRDGSDPFISTIGPYNVRIMLTVSNLVDTVNIGGGGVDYNRIENIVNSQHETTRQQILTVLSQVRQDIQDIESSGFDSTTILQKMDKILNAVDDTQVMVLSL